MGRRKSSRAFAVTWWLASAPWKIRKHRRDRALHASVAELKHTAAQARVGDPHPFGGP